MLVEYRIGNEIFNEDVDNWNNRKRIVEIYKIADDVRVPSEERYTNQDALRKMENEGSGYFVTSYCAPYCFIDETTRKLFKEAGDALNKLEKYLEDNQNK